MKTQLLTFALALALGQTAIAENTTQKIEQVTSSVTLSEDVDYIVTGTTPFARRAVSISPIRNMPS